MSGGTLTLGVWFIVTACLVVTPSKGGAAVLGSSRADYGTLEECRIQARVTVNGFKLFARSTGASDIKAIEFDHSPRGFQIQTFYSEAGRRLASFFVCDADGKATITHSTIE